MEKKKNRATKKKNPSPPKKTNNFKLGLLEKDVNDYTFEELEQMLKIITESKEILESMLYVRRATIYLLKDYINKNKPPNMKSESSFSDGFTHKKGDNTNWSGRGGDINK